MLDTHVEWRKFDKVQQDALDAIEYANGPTNTFWGGLRRVLAAVNSTFIVPPGT